MPRINEHLFKLNNEEYILTWHDKPRISKYGIEQKILPTLKEYITKENLPIQLVNKKGNNEVPYALARKVLDYFSREFLNEKQTLTTKNKITNKHMNSKKSADQKIHEILIELDWKKIQDSNVKKLLIIGCSDSKQINNNSSIESNKNYDFGESIKQSRNKRLKYYTELLENSKNTEYFKKKRGNNSVETSYFKNCIGKTSVSAFELYGSKKSPIYNPEMKKLLNEKIKDSNLDVLIISGLFGILRYDDIIFDYHLKINKGKNVFGKNLREAVTNYIETNQIDNDMVFYSLSKQYLQFLYKPEIEWKNLWFNHGGRGHLQAHDLKDFLHKM
jgi:cytoplasmic iron level regulating protein YaaA (DUF328/UPF0246 family)